MKNFESISKPVMWSMALLFSAVVAGCGGSSGGSLGAGGGVGAGPTGAVCSGASCVNLGTAGNYAILAKTGIATVPSSVVTGNVGVSPIKHGNVTAAVADQACALQLAGDFSDAFAAHAERAGNQFLRHGQIIRGLSIERQQQAAAQLLLYRMMPVAYCGLGYLRNQCLSVTQQ